MKCNIERDAAKAGARPQNEGDSPEPSASDIPLGVDLPAVIDILRRVYPHLDTEEIKRRLLQVMQGQAAQALPVE